MLTSSSPPARASSSARCRRIRPRCRSSSTVPTVLINPATRTPVLGPTGTADHAHRPDRRRAGSVGQLPAGQPRDARRRSLIAQGFGIPSALKTVPIRPTSSRTSAAAAGLRSSSRPAETGHARHAHRRLQHRHRRRGRQRTTFRSPTSKASSIALRRRHSPSVRST